MTYDEFTIALAFMAAIGWLFTVEWVATEVADWWRRRPPVVRDLQRLTHRARRSFAPMAAGLLGAETTHDVHTASSGPRGLRPTRPDVWWWRA